MTTDPDQNAAKPENGSERPPTGGAEEPARRFNPFAHEEDMFKVVLWAGAALLAIILLVTIARAAL